MSVICDREREKHLTLSRQQANTCGDATEGGGGPGYFITLSDNALDFWSETVEKGKGETQEG